MFLLINYLHNQNYYTWGPTPVASNGEPPLIVIILKFILKQQENIIIWIFDIKGGHFVWTSSGLHINHVQP